MGNFQKFRQILQIQIVAGIDTQPQFMGLCRCRRVPTHNLVLGGCPETSGIVFCIQFNPVRIDSRHQLHRCDRGIEEQTAAYARIAQLSEHIDQLRRVGANVPAMIGGQLIGLVRHQCALCRADCHHQVEKIFRWIPLNIEFNIASRLQVLTDIINILSRDMALIRSRMHRDTLNAQCQQLFDKFQQPGIVSPA